VCRNRKGSGFGYRGGDFIAAYTESVSFRGGKMRVRFAGLWLLVVAFCLSALGQTEGFSFFPNQEVRVESLPAIVASSKGRVDVMLASVATALMDPELCCGTKSALADQINGDGSLQEVGKGLRGEVRLSDGSSVTIVDRYWPGTAVSAGDIIGALSDRKPLLMEWNERVYVVEGAIFDEYRSYTGAPNSHIIRKLLLLDTRFPGERRRITFDRQTEDWSKVTGVLLLSVVR
jgi:hypothetical protein